MHCSKISLRTKFLLVVFLAMLFWFILSLFYLNALNHLQSREKLLEKVTFIQGEFNLLQSELMHAYSVLPVEDPRGGHMVLLNNALSQLRYTRDQLTEFRKAGWITVASPADHALNALLETMNNIKPALTAGVTQHTDSPSALLSLRSNMDDQFKDFLSLLLPPQNRNVQKSASLLKISLVASVFLIFTILFLFSRYLSSGFNTLIRAAQNLSGKENTESAASPPGDEFDRITSHLDASAKDLRDKVLFLQSIARGEYHMDFQPPANDRLGNELLLLSQHLSMKEQEDRERKEQDMRRNWISEGMAQLGEILRSEPGNVKELSFKIIQKLVSYLKAEMGTLFLTNDADPANPLLESVASFAYDRRKYIDRVLRWGEGLPGTCAQEKEPIFLTDIPEDYYEIVSGTGSTLPKCILLVPLKLEGNILGIIELASLKIMSPYEVDFIESVAESIASTLLTVKTNEKNAELLVRSRNQSDELLRKEEDLKRNLEQLKQAQEESDKKTSEISGIINAMNHSSLVAEYSLTGRISEINDRFTFLLEMPREQLIGKHHGDFALVDRYSGEYKDFWQSLKEGRSHSRIEQFRLFSGKEIWLQQTFTPIFNNEGHVYKILNIAIDITSNIEQQKNLEVQAIEIERKSREMASLNQAVNASLIKCEMDAEGVITDMNENFIGVTGYSRKEVLGRNYRLFLKDLEKEQFEKIWTEVKKEKTYEGVLRRTKPTGEECWLMSVFSPVKDESGAIYKIYFLALDITEKKLKYQLLENANREVERLRNKLKDLENA
ncbi:MAG: PAS domain S-box protein [Bacteroidales bacterium]|nr:PAS domain S-box protein [Bacteroidales bacterium]MBN2698702.1 PAS domain S-box protein [Bacteroidales bacterium]